MAFPTKREKAYKKRLEEAEVVLGSLRAWIRQRDLGDLHDGDIETITANALKAYDATAPATKGRAHG